MFWIAQGGPNLHLTALYYFLNFKPWKYKLVFLDLRIQLEFNKWENDYGVNL